MTLVRLFCSLYVNYAAEVVFLISVKKVTAICWGKTVFGTLSPVNFISQKIVATFFSNSEVFDFSHKSIVFGVDTRMKITLPSYQLKLLSWVGWG